MDDKQLGKKLGYMHPGYNNRKDKDKTGGYLSFTLIRKDGTFYRDFFLEQAICAKIRKRMMST